MRMSKVKIAKICSLGFLVLVIDTISILMRNPVYMPTDRSRLTQQESPDKHSTIAPLISMLEKGKGSQTVRRSNTVESPTGLSAQSKNIALTLDSKVALITNRPFIAERPSLLTNQLKRKQYPWGIEAQANAKKSDDKPDEGVTNDDNSEDISGNLRMISPGMIPDLSTLQNRTESALQEFYESYIETVQTVCNKVRAIRSAISRVYSICEDALTDEPCLMFSFNDGKRNESAFDVVISKLYVCKVDSFSFVRNHTGPKTSPYVTFHPFGLGAMDDPTRNIYTLDSILTRLNQHANIDILKIDIASKEWESLEQIADGQELEMVKLLIVEFYVCTQNCSEGAWECPEGSRDCPDDNRSFKDGYIGYLRVLKRLYDIGFRTYAVQKDRECTPDVRGVPEYFCHIVQMINQSLD